MPVWCTLECTSDLNPVVPRFDSEYGYKNKMMKTHTIEVKEENWKDSKYRTREWERRVDITRWEHDFVNKIYKITIRIKDK